MRTLGTVLGVLVGVLLIAALGVGAWKLGWIIEEKNTDRQVRIDNRNVGTQSAWRDQARTTVTQYQTVDEKNTAARGALKTQACSLIAKLRPDYQDADLMAFYGQAC